MLSRGMMSLKERRILKKTYLLNQERSVIHGRHEDKRKKRRQTVSLNTEKVQLLRFWNISVTYSDEIDTH